MFPLKHEAAIPKIPFATCAVMLLCGIVFVEQGRVMRLTNGLVPLDFAYALFHQGIGLVKMFVVLVAAFFMHASLFHLLSNMWFLWIFGSAVESRIGIKGFVIVYGMCGIIATIAQVASSPLSTIPIVGASGAIAGIMGITLVMLPFAKIFTWIPPIFLVHIPAFIFLLVWCGAQYYNLLLDRGDSHVAWWAHLGGFATGIAAGIFFRIALNGKPRRGGRRT